MRKWGEWEKMARRRDRRPTILDIYVFSYLPYPLYWSTIRDLFI